MATWSGPVISPPPGPSGGPSKTHLLPGDGVPQVHRARSPVLPRLPRFATPWSVHQFAAVAAGAYPLRHPHNAWSPGAPAPPGPCYWLVASGTPLPKVRKKDNANKKNDDTHHDVEDIAMLSSPEKTYTNALAQRVPRAITASQKYAERVAQEARNATNSRFKEHETKIHALKTDVAEVKTHVAK